MLMLTFRRGDEHETEFTQFIPAHILFNQLVSL